MELIGSQKLKEKRTEPMNSQLAFLLYSEHTQGEKKVHAIDSFTY